MNANYQEVGNIAFRASQNEGSNHRHFTSSGRSDVSFDPTYSPLTTEGKNAPALGCLSHPRAATSGPCPSRIWNWKNVSSDLRTVFASDPTELAAALNEASTNRAQAIADFEGIAMHCVAGNAVCSTPNHGEPDVLPQEPNGYSGFSALCGHKFRRTRHRPQRPCRKSHHRFSRIWRHLCIPDARLCRRHARRRCARGVLIYLRRTR